MQDPWRVVVSRLAAPIRNSLVGWLIGEVFNWIAGHVWAAVAAVIFGMLGMIWSLPGWAAFGLAGFTLIGVAVAQDHWKKRAVPQADPRLIPLPEAARLAYEQTKLADGLQGASGADRLRIHAKLIVLDAQHVNLTLYARRVPSSRLEPLPIKEALHTRLSQNLLELQNFSKPNDKDYENLLVGRDELDKHIRYLNNIVKERGMKAIRNWLSDIGVLDNHNEWPPQGWY